MSTQTFIVYGINIAMDDTKERQYCPIVFLGNQSVEQHSKKPDHLICPACKEKINKLVGGSKCKMAINIVREVLKNGKLLLDQEVQEKCRQTAEKILDQEPEISLENLKKRMTREFSNYVSTLVRSETHTVFMKREAKRVWLNFWKPSFYGLEKTDLVDEVYKYCGESIPRSFFEITFSELLPVFKKRTWEYLRSKFQNNIFEFDINEILEELEKSQNDQVPKLAKKITKRANLGYLPRRQFNMLLKVVDQEARESARRIRGRSKKKNNNKKETQEEIFQGIRKRDRVKVEFPDGTKRRVFHVLNQQEVDILKHDTVAFYNGRTVKVQKSKGGQVSLKDVGAKPISSPAEAEA